jgi:inorganic triphosphatase YgiF
MAQANIETEAKFIIPDQATFDALRQLTHLGQFELKLSGVKTVNDRYLDTADKRLFQAEWACRLRNVKGQYIITLKSLTPATSAFHRRDEIETTVKAAQAEPDQPGAWEAGQAQNLVIEIIGQTPLQTLFNLRQTRHQFHVCWQGQTVIELSLDEVSLHAPAEIDFRELEAELMGAGSEETLATFVEVLLAQWPLKPQPYSKFERAWFSRQENS